MLVGRLLFGIGRESYFITLNKITTLWFKGKELAFAFGLPLGVARATAAANSSLSPLIVDNGYDLYVPMAIGATVCFVSFVFVIIYNCLESWV
jgi:hypothetical protein